MHRTQRTFIDPSALMRIKSLSLRAKAVADGFQTGLHRSPYHGFSAEFSEYRQYTPGDDPRFLDWRLYARSDRYFIKRFEDETNRRCYLLVDISRSMQYTSNEHTKADYAGRWPRRWLTSWPNNGIVSVCCCLPKTSSISTRPAIDPGILVA